MKRESGVAGLTPSEFRAYCKVTLVGSMALARGHAWARGTESAVQKTSKDQLYVGT